MTDRPQTGVPRWLLRTPIPLYRGGYGRLFGHRLLHLAHRRRKSGTKREVVVEVVRHRQNPAELTVIAAWGGVPQWDRNVEAAPPIEVRCGKYRWPAPEARFLDNTALDEVLKGYRDRNPRAWSKIGPRLGFPADPVDPLWMKSVERVHGVAFAPARH
ncbi:nitroreductase family deazaflavin-dependent oxidoreductase [Amycolatopsis sp. NPDC005232]|uniref:nitroreductase family deazaflavin-dependent oxidoreductase n=1 Tax=Amycolatopsis sp. NPDC005232 TaxID=3157027 RepID=UPI0033B8EA15